MGSAGLSTIEGRIEDGVAEAWRVACSGDAIVTARERIDVEGARHDLAEVEGSSGSDAMDRTAQSLRAQLSSARRMEQTITEARDRLRLTNARLDEAVARAIELSVAGHTVDDVQGLGDDVEAIAHEMLDYLRADMLRIYFRDLDDVPEQRQRINERTLRTSYRVVAERIAAANPRIDADAAAAVLLGSLTYFRVNEALIGPDANGVARDRFVRTWGAVYRAILDGGVST